MGIQRRTFLKTGLLGALALALGGGIYRATRAQGAQPYALDPDARAALGAIVPALLADALPVEPGARGAAVAAATQRVQAAIAGLPLAVQKEVQDLFGLLALGPARRFLAGVPAAWTQATPEQAAAFLQAWRTHRFTLLQTAYHALHDLVLGAWYADPSTWAAIGYPGPIKELA